MKAEAIFNRIIAFFYPCRCPFCGKVIEPDKRLCEECKKSMAPENHKFFVGNRWLCASPFKYSSQARNAVFQLKYGDCGQISKPMSLYMLDAVKEEFSQYAFHMVAFVPMDKKRRRKSLYNHSQLLAKEISKNLRLPLVPLIRKIKHNKLQHTLTPEERLSNVQGVYRINPKYKEDIKGKTILLCDDVMTTGATLCECCRILEEAGAEDVFCVTFAKA